MKYRQVKQRAQGHTANKQQGQFLNIENLAPESRSITTVLC